MVKLKMNYEGVSNEDPCYCAIFGTCHYMYKNGNNRGQEESLTLYLFIYLFICGRKCPCKNL